eukprot:TRINITY_DN3414_c0_g1_i1.p2 TRINITY_DN3414_c0_g1~~TRINITY_DN3414_c0_g1_i1.p2  ORF type:complete len:150 (+),score=35.58 TRINITY_DN3414_c0_g1_i1:206-655(+)
MLTKKLASGGPDGGYALQANAEGTLGFANFTAVKDIPKALAYLGTAYHTTYGAKHYNDTVNMNIYPYALYEGNSVLEVFSVSQIPGAYGDYGQNFKNIMQLVRTFLPHVVSNQTLFGCGSVLSPPCPPPALVTELKLSLIHISEPTRPY